MISVGFQNSKSRSISTIDELNALLDNKKYVEVFFVQLKSFLEPTPVVHQCKLRIFKVLDDIFKCIEVPNVKTSDLRNIKVESFEPMQFGVGLPSDFNPNYMNLLFLDKENANQYHNFLKSDIFRKDLINWIIDFEIDNCICSYEQIRRNHAIGRLENRGQPIPDQFRILGENPPRPTPEPKPSEFGGFFDDKVFGKILIISSAIILILVTLIFYLLR